MLRNIINLRLLHSVGFVKHVKVPPVLAEVPDATRPGRNFSLDAGSEEATSHDAKTSSEHHQRGTTKNFVRKAGRKGRELHRRVLSEEQIAEQVQMRCEVKKQPSGDSFGQLVQEQGFSEHPQNLSATDTKLRGHNRSERPRMTTTEPGVTERQDDSTYFATGVVKFAEKESDSWINTFGTMADDSELLPFKQHGSRISADTESVQYEDDDDEDDHHVRLRQYGLHSGRTAASYGRRIERLGRDRKVADAIKLFEDTMIKEDRIQPTAYVFTVLIGICGRVGYTKKAFSLFTQMKKYQITPEDPTYTGLFNACANSPWPEDGLKRADRLLRQMREKDIEPNNATLKAIVKAYGRLGQLQTAFTIVDEMMAAGHRMDTEACKHLLIACISDKHAGLNHAIKVWRLMRAKKLRPDLQLYNLLLRAARDCGVGDEKFASELVSGTRSFLAEGVIGDAPASTMKQQPTLLPHESFPPADNTPSELVISHADQYRDEQHPQQISSISGMDAFVPNLLNPRGIWRHGNLRLGSVETSEARLRLLGGLAGILSHLEHDQVQPDIKTFSQLLDMCPNHVSAEEDLLAAMNTHGVKPDVDLLNQIIRRRCWRKDLDSATEVLDLFGYMKIQPNLLTYGSLSLGCYNYFTGLKLLNDMESMGMHPTTDIFGILLRRSRNDFRYKKALCKRMSQLNIKPNVNIVERLEASVSFARKMIVAKEKGERVHRDFQRAKVTEEFGDFMKFYKPWLINNQLHIDDHPWAQFRKPTEPKDEQLNEHEFASETPEVML